MSDAWEFEQALSQRKSILESFRIGKSGEYDEEDIRRRIEHWKEISIGFLKECYALRGAIEAIDRRYVEGHQTLFPAVSEGFDQLLALLEEVVGVYNGTFVGDIEGVEKLSIETRDGSVESPLTIDLAVLADKVQGSSKEQVAYFVDMAKADALGLLGENRQALELVDRHV